MTTVAVPPPAPARADAHRAEAAGYKAHAPAIRAAMLALVAEFASLCDEAVSLTVAAVELDARSRALALDARSNGESEPALPSAFEETVHALKGLDPEYGGHLARLWTSALRGRREAGAALRDLFDVVERRR